MTQTSSGKDKGRMILIVSQNKSAVNNAFQPETYVMYGDRQSTTLIYSAKSDLRIASISAKFSSLVSANMKPKTGYSR